MLFKNFIAIDGGEEVWVWFNLLSVGKKIVWLM